MPDFDPIVEYGLTALPADPSEPEPKSKQPEHVPIASLSTPATPLARRIQEYVKTKLPEQTYNHSLRVYTYGRIIVEQYFPQFGFEAGSKLDETWFITAMLHDIGTTAEHIRSTRLSYEFWAGLHARDILLDPKLTTPSNGSSEEGGGAGVVGAVAEVEQMESIVEAIIRHQDVQPKGSITTLTRLIHLGTLMDNIGKGEEMIHADTIAELNEVYERKSWSGCFRDTVILEKELKPWAMVSRIEGFEEDIQANGDGVMKQWDQ